MICQNPNCDVRDDTHTANKDWYDFEHGYCSEECFTISYVEPSKEYIEDL